MVVCTVYRIFVYLWMYRILLLQLAMMIAVHCVIHFRRVNQTTRLDSIPESAPQLDRDVNPATAKSPDVGSLPSPLSMDYHSLTSLSLCSAETKKFCCCCDCLLPICHDSCFCLSECCLKESLWIHLSVLKKFCSLKYLIVNRLLITIDVGLVMSLFLCIEFIISAVAMSTTI